MRIVEVRDHVVEKCDASVACDQALDECVGTGGIGTNEQSPQRFRIRSPWHDDPSITNADTATKHGKDFWMLSKVLKRPAVAGDPAKRLIIER